MTPGEQAVRTIYAASHGDYSSYRVECLFDNEADAKAYIRAVNPTNDPWPEWRVENFQLWSVVPVVNWTSEDDYEVVAP